ncbi:hypothetical protein MASR1M60_07620 [Rhodocyclaceae bacterium]
MSTTLSIGMRLMKNIMVAVEAWMDEECEGCQITLPANDGSTDGIDLLIWNEDNNYMEGERR